MDLSARKILANLFYYSFALLLIAFSIIFMIMLGNKDIATGWLVVYYIWSGLLILAVVLDAFSAMRGQYRFGAGLLNYLLSITFLVVGFVIYFRLSTDGVVPAANLDVFSTLIYFPLALTIALNVLFSLGNKMIRVNEE